MTWHIKGGIDRKRWKSVRLSILDRDNWQCVCCGKSGRMEVDHIKPLEDGGEKYNPSNLQTLARGCHIEKTRGERIRKTARPEVIAWREFINKRLLDSV